MNPGLFWPDSRLYYIKVNGQEKKGTLKFLSSLPLSLSTAIIVSLKAGTRLGLLCWKPGKVSSVNVLRHGFRFICHIMCKVERKAACSDKSYGFCLYMCMHVWPCDCCIKAQCISSVSYSTLSYMTWAYYQKIKEPTEPTSPYESAK